MADANMTINEALIWLKTLRARHAELVGLRNQNSQDETRFYGSNADKMVEKKATYDVKALDKLVTGVAQEIRRVELAVKQANASTSIGVAMNEAALGQIE